ncbi:hypothetical protein COLO4_06999 [Corchorus olitorius]|uniref:DNA polymerase epsilon catalytic subunit n=1 Tax=Corchorus olitorius TaxID=93759 RepID=A0A1R3KL87_9ROSI|nr:hypothetical protein COLO4_06999 [Corchorus olitorius]
MMFLTMFASPLTMLSWNSDVRFGQWYDVSDMVVLYDSLQLAHKCILNSFYGYVMRKGARWYSMEMAGVVTYTGAKIIQNACLLVEKLGNHVNWTQMDIDNNLHNMSVRDSKKKLTISDPCVMLNVDVARNNTNDQYQILSKTYSTHSECSIEFEVDGPYKAMIIPASKEEGILIKKNYAVFNDDGTLAELEGFEIKRRGELKLIKVFQAELFDKFLNGSTLEECYSAVAAVANRWLDLLDNQGKDIADSELLDYISESSTMSKSLADYGEQKSCAVTTARCLANFLANTFKLTEVMKFYLRKWCKTSSDVGIRSIVDWSYYKQRLSSAIQKIITIPAAMQKVTNPVPRVAHPDWLHKKVHEKEDKFRQRKLVDIFNSSGRDNIVKKANDAVTANHVLVGDLEDFQKKSRNSEKGPMPIVRCYEVNNNKHPVKAAVEANSVQQQLSSPLQPNVLPTENIDKNVDYQGWLELKKRKWKDNLERRKRQRVLRRTGVGSYFRRHEVSLTSSHRQLVPGSHAGQFFAWVVVDGIMLKVHIAVQRVFYLNSKATISEIPGRRVMIDEDQFRKESKKLAALLADPEIEDVWSLSELHMKTITECAYLEQSISFFYLYHSTCDGRAIYAGYFSSSRAVHVVALSIEPPARDGSAFRASL